MNKITHQFSTGTMFRLYILAFVTVMVPSCIITRTDRKVDDGSTSLTKSDSLAIEAFSMKDVNMSRNYSVPIEIKFQVIDAEKVNQMITHQPFTWIVVGASWCPVSKQALGKFNQIIRVFPSDSLRLVIISQDLNIPLLQQELFEAKYNFIPYLLSSDKYGRDEIHKQENFVKDLHWDLPLKAFKDGGVPMNIIVDNRKQVKYLFAGVRITADSIIKYSGLAKIN